VHIEIVQALLAVPGIDVNTKTNDGNSALMWAASRWHTEIVQALLAVPGIDVNARDNEGYSSLDRARYDEIRALLTASGANNEGRSLVVGLFVSTSNGDEADLEAVLEEAGAAGGEAGAAAVTALVNSQDREGRTCLCVAVDARRVQIVERLCWVPGLDANLGRIDGGWSALILAARKGHTKIVQALLAFPGIDVIARDNSGRSALDLAASEGNTEIVQALLAVPGIDVNARDNDGWSALIEAASGGNTESVQALLAVPGIDVNARDNGGNSALVLAALLGHTKTVLALLAAWLLRIWWVLALVTAVLAWAWGRRG
jgi:ankyrin repeat protein